MVWKDRCEVAKIPHTQPKTIVFVSAEGRQTGVTLKGWEKSGTLLFSSDKLLPEIEGRVIIKRILLCFTSVQRTSKRE